MSEVNNKIPRLRFPEFEGLWEEMNIVETAESINSGKTKPNPKGKYPVFGSMGIIGYSDNASHNGSHLLIARVGANAGSLNIASGNFSVTDNTLIFNVKKNYSLYFIYQKLFAFNLNKLIFGSGQPLITAGQLKDLKISLPSLPEQQKIADFLSLIDKRIELLKEKKKQLEIYKKGVMQKIFNQEIRFKDENGNNYPDWEEKRLGDIGNFISGVGFSSNEQGGKIGIPFYKVSDMNNPSNLFYMKKANNYVSDEQIRKKGYKVINKCAIIFAKVGEAIFLERKRIAKDFLIDNNMMAFIPNFNILFFKYLFEKIFLSKYAQVGALPSYNASDLSIIKINLPSLPEQQKIADFLSSIDKKIEIYTNQIAKNEEYKKGLLQQMFV